MKKWNMATLSTLMLVTSLSAKADPSDVLLSFEYGSTDAEYRISGTDYDGDLDLFSVSGRYYLSDNAYLSVSSTTGDGTISNVSFDASGLSIGGGVVLLGRTDYISGKGQELRLGLSYSDTEVSTSTTTSDSTNTDFTGGFSAGLGDGFTGSVSFSADSDGSAFGVGATKHIANNVLVGLTYSASDSDLSGSDTAESSTISFGLGYAF
jgi:hypothetical protein